MEIGAAFAIIGVIVGVMLIVSPLAIWSECRQIRKRLDSIIDLLQSDEGDMS